ncbi:unnamed protein product [Leuciscus chuanchicus]
MSIKEEKLPETVPVEKPIVRNTMRTLNNLSDLRESRFGRPPPRHGLNLLWWFAHECVDIDSNGRMVALCNPKNGAFGFCLFHNRERLLPYSDLPYYEVGNLHITDSLPEYVTEDDTGFLDDDSNTDRIIVLFKYQWFTRRFDNIYVTKHSDQTNFDRNHTYCISSDLMKEIKELSREEFLKKTLNESYQIHYQMQCRRSQFPSAAHRIVRNTMRTLNNLSDLKKSKFGRPPPRHGLILLWWFAHECVQIDFNSRMVALCNPKNGAFGFHRFYNRENLLPYSDRLYYEVGNLNITDSLPEYVTVYYTGRSDDDSNTDRIIVLFNSRRKIFESIYVTRHSDLVNFDQNHTYCISIELMKIIQDLSCEEFLRGPIRKNLPNPPQYVSIDIPWPYHPPVPARLPHTPQPHTPQPHTPPPVQSETCRMQCVFAHMIVLDTPTAVSLLQFRFPTYRIGRNTMRTLNNLSDLRESRFGQPSPRHGLKLLWWFAHECVDIDNNGRIIALCNPAHRDFGFCLFHNREGLLPYSDLPYYEVGNLNTPNSLPEYVTEDDTGRSDDDSNTDRIIVLFKYHWSTPRFDRIYVTQHSDPVNFDHNHTYCIRIKLIKAIKRLSRNEFISKTWNDSYPITIEQQCLRLPFPSAARDVLLEEENSTHLKSSIMVKETLNELSQLKQSGFGQPCPPRHGLNLLYWFAQDYIDFSCDDIVLRFRPQNGDFGFHKFENRIEDEEDDHLLPIQNLPYYEVGNLNYSGADKLPNYVRANYSRNIPDNNKDRVIVRLDANGRFNRVYVTEHSDPKRFDGSKTFRVSQGLLQIIKNKSRDQYLSELSNTGENLSFEEQCHHETAPENKSSWWCAIL